MQTKFLEAEKLRVLLKQTRFSVKDLSLHVGVGVRTLERRFTSQFRTTPKAWIMRERMNSAPPLLAAGFSNKQVAAALSYTSESNFCRDFKRCFGHAPQKFIRARMPAAALSHSDKELSRFDSLARLSWAGGEDHPTSDINENL